VRKFRISVYERFWWSGRDSNPQPRPYEGAGRRGKVSLMNPSRISKTARAVLEEHGTADWFSRRTLTEWPLASELVDATRQ